ncbi:MAG: type II secretion system GspH family protein [Rikenellaceae bacterium]|jgi:prepilin-type N-terminal cleavage/methylation domain-containing protein|nr:type II secretion system GspH family protein [Rikenellaceae bacterium]
MTKRKSIRRALSAMTLPELLVVMILAGIVLMAVFEGFSLFRRLVFEVRTKLERTVERTATFHALDRLFMGSDSIPGDAAHLEFFRAGEVFAEIEIEDSLLILSRSGRTDTVMRLVSLSRVVENLCHPLWVDSLLLIDDTTRFGFGVSYGPDISARHETEQLESAYDQSLETTSDEN